MNIMKKNKQNEPTNNFHIVTNRCCFLTQKHKLLCSFLLLILATTAFWGACSLKSSKNANTMKGTANKNVQETPLPNPTNTPVVIASIADKVAPLTITGKCGKNAKWSYNTRDQKLIISGTGIVDQIIKLSKQYINDFEKKAKYRVKEIKIEEGITALDGGALFFHTCLAKGMKEIKISLPDSLEKIGADTFDHEQASCVYFRHIHLPKNVRYIEGGAFWGLGEDQCDAKTLSKLFKKKLTISIDPDNPYYTVENNVLFTKDKKALVYYPSEKLDKVYEIPKSVTKIESLAFARNHFLNKIILPVNLEEIGDGAFWGDSCLSTVNLHEAYKLEKLGDFNGKVHNLQGSYVSSGTPIWVRYPYIDDITSTEEQRYYDAKEDAYKMMGTFEGTDLREIHFPDNLKYAAYNTFSNCVNLEKITLGKSFAGDINPVDYLDKKGFLLPLDQSIDKFDIQIPSENKHFKIKNNVLYSGDGKTVYGITNSYQGTTLTLDKTVKKITANAFVDTKLKKVTVLGDLELIGRSAFMYCSDLKSFEAMGNIDTIGIEAFYYCDKLNRVVCHGKIKTIRIQAFYGFSKLQGFPTAENAVETIGIGALPNNK
ncbi:MAG: leucine-rich repeat domain-containing protein [Lachnospiraceae bacterium]|nr:leucine-rich repeat domain-containing protein [Lachnospiraceae bacterium]